MWQSGSETCAHLCLKGSRVLKARAAVPGLALGQCFFDEVESSIGKDVSGQDETQCPTLTACQLTTICCSMEQIDNLETVNQSIIANSLFQNSQHLCVEVHPVYPDQIGFAFGFELFGRRLGQLFKRWSCQNLGNILLVCDFLIVKVHHINC